MGRGVGDGRAALGRADAVTAMDAPRRVLVCYASAAGSTRGIAERIAARIRNALPDQGAVEVTCRGAGPDMDPAGFDAIVVGSAVHNMAWLPAATSFLRRAAETAAPVWVFSVGGVEPRGPFTRMLADRERATVARAFPPGFEPRDHRMFCGIVLMTGVPLWGRLFWRLIGGRPGDHRNWPAIDAWADGIAARLSRASAPRTPPPTAPPGVAPPRAPRAPAALRAWRRGGRPSRGAAP